METERSVPCSSWLLQGHAASFIHEFLFLNSIFILQIAGDKQRSCSPLPTRSCTTSWTHYCFPISQVVDWEKGLGCTIRAFSKRAPGLNYSVNRIHRGERERKCGWWKPNTFNSAVALWQRRSGLSQMKFICVWSISPFHQCPCQGR